jgi:hypothetical protein
VDVVQCLVKEFEADVNRAKPDGTTPLFIAAYRGNQGVMRWLLAEGGASVDERSPQGHTLWQMMKLEEADDAELALLLQTMVLVADAPLEFIAKLSSQHTDLCVRGRQLRTQLPVYLQQQRASIFAQCPLPRVLLPLVAKYAATTSEDIWTDGLRVSVVE